jgi:integrase
VPRRLHPRRQPDELDQLGGIAQAEAEAALDQLAAEPPVTFPDRKELILRGRAAMAGRDYNPDDQVPPEVDRELIEGIPRATREQYEQQWGRFILWCGLTGREHLPPTVATMRFYIWSHWHAKRPDGTGAGRGGKPYAAATVRTAVYSVSAVLQWLGYASPTGHPSIGAQLKVYEAKCARAGMRPQQAYPLSPDDSVTMARACDLSTVQGLRLATMVRLQYDMGARESEIVGLNIEDVSWRRAGKAPQVAIWVGRSKGHNDGRELLVEAVPDVNGDVDPALLLGRWVDALAAAGITDGPLFCEVNRGNPRKDGQLAGSFRAGVRLERGAYEKAFGRLAVRSGVNLDPKTNKPTRQVTTHSARRGMITASVNAGMLVQEVAPRTGHSIASNEIHGYWGASTREGDANAGTRIRLEERRRREKAAEEVPDGHEGTS